MAADRRIVRVAASFFDQLDEQVGTERSAAGTPSSTDFLVIELPAVIERFATDFEGLPEVIEGAQVGRMLIASRLLVRAFAVYGLRVADGSVELVGITIDP